MLAACGLPLLLKPLNAPCKPFLLEAICALLNLGMFVAKYLTGKMNAPEAQTHVITEHVTRNFTHECN